MTKSIYDQLNASGTVAKSRFVETFTGDALDTDRWSAIGGGSGTPTFAMDDYINANSGGGLKVTAGAQDNGDAGLGSNGTWDGYNIRHFSPTGSVYIDVFKNNTAVSTAKSLCHGFGERIRGDSAGNNAALFRTDSRQTLKFRVRICSGTGSQANEGDTSMTADLNWHSYKIECDSTYKFSIDGVLEYTSPTTNLPTGAMAPISGIQGTSEATAPSYSIKYVECYNT
jgi:hypothetical protein|tara:strand:+ start:539 stop:1219 length:681 start_codon:yes stop_codon:yes gene_type:complete